MRRGRPDAIQRNSDVVRLFLRHIDVSNARGCDGLLPVVFVTRRNGFRACCSRWFGRTGCCWWWMVNLRLSSLGVGGFDRCPGCSCGRFAVWTTRGKLSTAWLGHGSIGEGLAVATGSAPLDWRAARTVAGICVPRQIAIMITPAIGWLEFAIKIAEVHPTPTLRSRRSCAERLFSALVWVSLTNGVVSFLLGGTCAMARIGLPLATSFLAGNPEVACAFERPNRLAEPYSADTVCCPTPAERKVYLSIFAGWRYVRRDTAITAVRISASWLPAPRTGASHIP